GILMTAKRIFAALTLTAIVITQAATAQAQSNTCGAVLPQDEELIIRSVEEKCLPVFLQPQLTGECPKANAPQLKGAWLITFNPFPRDASHAFISLATFTSDGGVLNSSAGLSIGGRHAYSRWPPSQYRARQYQMIRAGAMNLSSKMRLPNKKAPLPCSSYF